ncbi:MAG: O-antigen ligase family protein, partial [Candidatus Omnitrophica bacterium]|nr:O-antigen ligase family protein [Candidatus Omnitrophota bacterium]
FAMVISLTLGLIKGIFSLEVSDTLSELRIAAPELTKVRGAHIVGLIIFVISVSLATILPKGRRKSLFMVLSLFFGITEIVSFARSLWIAAIFGLAFLFFVLSGKQKLNFLKLATTAVLLVSLYIAIAMSLPSKNLLYKSLYSVGKRYLSIFITEGEPTMMTRDVEIKEALRKAFMHPFLGNGLGTEITYFRYDRWFGVSTWTTPRYIHNAYVYLFLNMGILGVITFLCFCISLIRYGLKLHSTLEDEMDKAVTLGITCAFISLMVASLAGPLLTSPGVTVWLGFFIGALFVIDRSQKKMV